VRDDDGVRARRGRWLEGSACLLGIVDEVRRGAAVEFEVLYMEKSIAGGR